MRYAVNRHGASFLYDRRDGATICIAVHPFVWSYLNRPLEGGNMWTRGPVTYVRIGGAA